MLLLIHDFSVSVLESDTQLAFIPQMSTPSRILKFASLVRKWSISIGFVGTYMLAVPTEIVPS